MKYRYKGKTALITGASSGIGEVFARNLSQRGMDVILVARSGEALRTLATELSATYGVRAEVMSADLSKEGASAQVKAAMARTGLQVDLLVNNAGFGTYDRFEDIDPQRDHQQVMLNVAAVVDLAHAFLPEMARRDDGALINVSSMAAFQAMPYMAVYGASKAFVMSFSQALWGEYRERGIRVVALCPGQVETTFHEKMEHEAPAAGVKVTAQQAVEAALRTLEQGRSYIVPGAMNAVAAQSTRLMSRAFLVKSAAKMLRPKDAKGVHSAARTQQANEATITAARS
jgi:uncharacterized protein